MWPQMSSSLAIRAMLHWDFHLYPYMSCLWMILVNLTRFRDIWFFPLPFNAMVTKMTWPQAIDIKNPRSTSCRYPCHHRQLQVTSHSVTYCYLGVMSNFEKLDLRWGNSQSDLRMWPFEVCKKKQEMRKNDQRTAMPIFTVLASPLFFRYFRKPSGGGGRIPLPAPPSVRGIIHIGEKYLHSIFQPFLGTGSSYNQR